MCRNRKESSPLSLDCENVFLGASIPVMYSDNAAEMEKIINWVSHENEQFWLRINMENNNTMSNKVHQIMVNV